MWVSTSKMTCIPPINEFDTQPRVLIVILWTIETRPVQYGKVVVVNYTVVILQLLRYSLLRPESLGQCIPLPSHILPVLRYGSEFGSVSRSVILIATKM